MSDQFLKNFPEMGIQEVYEVQCIDHYYMIVNQFRRFLKMDVCEKNKGLLNLDYGTTF